jgi:spore cortex formation protein SpoVR/YcgB (stage V sporulation)
VINAIIHLVDGSVLQIRVYVDAKYKIEIISYAYQYHDIKGKLIFRYDNARHKPELGFKDHKHQNDGSMMQSSMPEISDVLDEVIKYI